MKVGLLGSHSTGKTSVATRYAELTGARLVTSASRRVHALGYPINQQATTLSQAATSMARLAAQLDAGEKFVSDRTLLDSMAYNQYQLDTAWDADPQAQFWYDTMDVISRHMMHQYDALFYFPITFPLTEDGIRAVEAEYQQEIDERILDFIDDYELDVYTVPNGSVEERVHFMIGETVEAT